MVQPDGDTVLPGDTAPIVPPVPTVLPVTRLAALPVEDISVPAVLTGKKNGQLPIDILDVVAGLAGGPRVTLLHVTMRAWNAMVNDAQTHGIILQSTSSADSYRPAAGFAPRRLAAALWFCARQALVQPCAEA